MPRRFKITFWVDEEDGHTEKATIKYLRKGVYALLIGTKNAAVFPGEDFDPTDILVEFDPETEEQHDAAPEAMPGGGT